MPWLLALEVCSYFALDDVILEDFSARCTFFCLKGVLSMRARASKVTYAVKVS